MSKIPRGTITVSNNTGFNKGDVVTFSDGSTAVIDPTDSTEWTMVEEPERDLGALILDILEATENYEPAVKDKVINVLKKKYPEEFI